MQQKVHSDPNFLMRWRGRSVVDVAAVADAEVADGRAENDGAEAL